MDKKYVVVKFADGSAIPYEDDAGTRVEKDGLGDWTAVKNAFRGIVLNRLFVTLTRSELEAFANRARERSPGVPIRNLLSYFRIDPPKGFSAEEVAEVVRARLNAERVYVRYPAPDPMAVPADDPWSTLQGHLGQAPAGIDARYAWRHEGGCGEGQRLVDVERGWGLGHEDLSDLRAVLLGGINDLGSMDHGARVLGIVAAPANGKGVLGIAPRLGGVGLHSFILAGGEHAEDAIATAAAKLTYGDVLLLEMQSFSDATAGVCGPTELVDAEFSVIKVATLGGVIVVEAAGNGDTGQRFTNLDTQRDGDNKLRYFRDASNPEYEDSGAIIVSAATAGVPHAAMPWATRGKRIDCYAWGEGVTTASYDPLTGASSYVSRFGGTSSAAAVVAGAALVVQGVLEARGRARLDPIAMRSLLSDRAWNTAPAWADVGRIGVQPDLRGILARGLGCSPDFPEPSPPVPIPIPQRPAPPLPRRSRVRIRVPAATADWGDLAFIGALFAGFAIGVLTGLFVGLVVGGS